MRGKNTALKKQSELAGVEARREAKNKEGNGK